MKKVIYKVIIFILVITVLPLALIKINKVIKIKNIENEVVDILNFGLKFNELPEEDKKLFELARKPAEEVFDISKGIAFIIDSVDKSIRVNYLDEVSDDDVFRFEDIDNNKQYYSFKSIDKDLFLYVNKYITDEDKIDSKTGTFKNKLAQRIEKVIQHNSEEYDKGWVVPNDKNKRIELPYNLYIDFEYGTKKIKDVKKVNSVKLDGNIDSRPLPNNFIVNYLDNNDKEKIENLQVDALINGSKGKKIMEIYAVDSLVSFFIEKGSSIARFEVGHHDYNKMKEDDEKKYKEMENYRIAVEKEAEKLYEERGEKINHITIDIPYFKEYENNKIFVYLHIDEFEKRIEIEFSAQGYVKKLDNILFRQYVLSKYPSSIDKALDLYMSDEERVKRDEEFIINVLINEDMSWYETHKDDMIP